MSHARPSKSWLRLWPAALVYCCFALLILATFGLSWPVSLSFHQWLGILAGFTTLGVMIGGSVGRNWVTGWLLVVILSSICILCGSASQLRLGNDEPLGFLLLVPLPALTACMPLIAMRNLFGWSLTLHRQLEISRTRTTVEDQFLIGVAMAACLSIFSHAESFLRVGPQMIVPMLMAGSILIGTAIGIPLVYIAFRVQNWATKIALALVYVFSFAAVAISLNVLVSNGPIALAIRVVGQPILSASVVVALGCIVLRASGLRLTHFKKAATASPGLIVQADQLQNSLDHLPSATRALESEAKAPARWYPRLATGMVVAVAGVLVVFQVLAYQRNRSFWREIKGILNDPEQHIADIWAPEGQVTEVVVTDQFDDDDLHSLVARFPSISTLNLAGSKVTGVGLACLIGNTSLHRLDLSDTRIKSADLLQIKAPNLYWLSLAGTQISLHEALSFANMQHLYALDVSRTGVTDQQLAEVNLVTAFGDLSLAGNPITDEGLVHLSKFNGLMKVNLSDTPITGTGIAKPQLGRIAHWILDGTQITDGFVTELVKSGIQSLSIRRTNVTAAALASLAGLTTPPIDLQLGGGVITEQDLMKLPAITFSKLRLNDPQFTGACLATGNLRADYIDLSHSSVRTQDVVALGPYSPFSLDVSHTSIPLSVATQSGAYEIVFRGNSVNASDLLVTSRSFVRVVLRHQQLTAEQAAQFQRSSSDIAIDMDSISER